jgi:hypothetical protein
MRKEAMGGCEDGGRTRNRRDRVGRGRQESHGRDFQESGTGEPGRRSLLNRPGLAPARPASHSPTAVTVDFKGWPARFLLSASGEAP